MEFLVYLASVFAGLVPLVIHLGLMVGIAAVGLVVAVGAAVVKRKKDKEVPLFDDIPKPKPSK